MTITLRLREDKVIDGQFMVMCHDMTEKEYYEFADEDLDSELINGVLIIHSPANPEHEDIFGYLYSLLRYFLEATSQGRVFGSRLAMRLSPTWSPEPDILVITPEKYDNLREGRLEGPADFIIEILSKSTKELDLEKKLPQYLTSGVSEIWIVDPLEMLITVHKGGKVLTYNKEQADQKIDSQVLRGFFVRVKWIWNRESYTLQSILTEGWPSERAKRPSVTKGERKRS